jgi:hypothetical protein
MTNPGAGDRMEPANASPHSPDGSAAELGKGAVGGQRPAGAWGGGAHRVSGFGAGAMAAAAGYALATLCLRQVVSELRP